MDGVKAMAIKYMADRQKDVEKTKEIMKIAGIHMVRMRKLRPPVPRPPPLPPPQQRGHPQSRKCVACGTAEPRGSCRNCHRPMCTGCALRTASWCPPCLRMLEEKPTKRRP